jgi:hypothetical protein
LATFSSERANDAGIKFEGADMIKMQMSPKKKTHDERLITKTVAFVFASIIVLALALWSPCPARANQFTSSLSIFSLHHIDRIL